MRWNKKFIYLCILFLILTVPRLFFLTTNQAAWWDESENLLKVKHFLEGTPDIGRWDARAPLFPLLLTIFTPFNYNETLIYEGFALISILTVIIFFLLFCKLFDEETAFFASLIFGFEWSYFFYSFRILETIPAVALMGLAFYLFHCGIKESSKLKMCLTGIAIGLLFFLRYPEAVITALIIFLYVLADRNLRAKSKSYLWIPFSILTVIPFLIYDWITFGNPLWRELAYISTNVGVKDVGIFTGSPFYYVLNSINFLTITLVAFFILGLIYMIMGKNKNERFVLIAFFAIFAMFSLITSIKSDRYIIGLYPFVSLIGVLGIKWIASLFSQKNIAFLWTLIAVLVIVYLHLSSGISAINSKSDSYIQIKEAGIWIKENSNKEDVVFSSSVPQNVHYSERATYSFPDNESGFNGQILKFKPKYMVLSLFEQSPEWIYKWPEENKLSVYPVKVIFLDKEQKQPAVIIYQFIYA